MVRRLTKQGLGNVIDTESVQPEKPKRARKWNKNISPEKFEELLAETSALRDEKRWSEFEPKSFVALYCMLHAHVYGVVPDEVRDNFKLVVQMAEKMLEQQFSGNNEAMIEFMRWVWQREFKRNKTRDAENDFRIGWRLQFGSTFLSDYRVARARAGKKVQ